MQAGEDASAPATERRKTRGWGRSEATANPEKARVERARDRASKDARLGQERSDSQPGKSESGARPRPSVVGREVGAGAKRQPTRKKREWSAPATERRRTRGWGRSEATANPEKARVERARDRASKDARLGQERSGSQPGKSESGARPRPSVERREVGAGAKRQPTRKKREWSAPATERRRTRGWGRSEATANPEKARVERARKVKN